MQTLLSPAARSGTPYPPLSLSPSAGPSLPSLTRRPIFFNRTTNLSSSPYTISSFSLSSLKPFPCHSSSSFSPVSTLVDSNSIKSTSRRRVSLSPIASAAVSPAFSPPTDESERAKLAQVAKRLEKTSKYFKRLGGLGFWGQLVCTVVAAVILSFSVAITGKITSPVTFYATAGSITAAFISIFWSFGYIRLSEKLQRTATEPSKAPPRADVVKSLKNGIVVNLLGMGAAILGMLATVGLLVAKALTSSANPYSQGSSPGYSPVLPLDVFLVQASANTILSHFWGLVFSLELLRSVTLPPAQGIPVPRAA